MAIPLIYNIRSVSVRWVSTSVAVFGIAGVVTVFVAMLAMAQGFQATLVASGSPLNAMVRRGGANSEMDSALPLEQIRIVADAPGVMRDEHGNALISPEVVIVVSLPLRNSNDRALVQMRGVSPRALTIRDMVKVSRGRFFTPGLTELVVGANAAKAYRDFHLGGQPRFAGRQWTVVGVLDAQGSAFDSEIWADAEILKQTYKKPEHLFQSATVRLSSRESFGVFRQALARDPRLSVQVERELDYYERQSQAVATIIRVLGVMVAVVMGIGAIFAALNTMYSSIAARSREIATIRALGFSEVSIIVSFVCESLFIALIGGIIGCIAVIPINGYSTSTINWQTFSSIAFSFKVTPVLLVQGMLFALFMGLLGGIPPAVRAARLPVVVALREL
ncbi:MAG: ABC transporter permease [Desulfobacterota bacterium]|nr:ABC transporter permease [Thermodesulfobacteriota bacterium]